MSDHPTTNHISAPSVVVHASDITGGVDGDVIVRSWVADAIDADWTDLFRVAVTIGFGLTAGVCAPFAIGPFVRMIVGWLS